MVAVWFLAGVGMYLNRHLQPHMLESLALNITGLTNDDLFYYKNKPRIDNVALSYQATGEGFGSPGLNHPNLSNHESAAADEFSRMIRN